MTGVASGYFRTNIFLLKIAGLWPPSDESKSSYKIYRVFQAVVFVLAVVYNPIAIIVGTAQKFGDFPELMEAININTVLLLSAAKYIFWLVNFGEIRRTLSTLANDVLVYPTDVGGFDLEAEVRKADKLGTRLTLTYYSFGMLAIGFTYIPVLIASLWCYYNDLPISDFSTQFEAFPDYVYVPVRRDTPLRYGLASIVQLIPTIFQAHIVMGIDSLFMNVLNLIRVHMVILEDAFGSLRRRCLTEIRGRTLTLDKLYNSDELEAIMMAEMKRCIRSLQMILRTCDDVEGIFKYITLAQVIGSMLITCSSMLVLSMTPVFTEKFAKIVFYTNCILLQIGLTCWFGNEVTLKGLDVPRALWQSDWLEARRPFKICVYLTMMRMNNPIYLTAGKFTPLTLNTFIVLLKASYSFYTMLQTVKN